MTDDTKLTIEKFNGTNFAYWKMQIEDLLYQKNLYLPLGGKAKKPATMSDVEWDVLDRKALSTVRLSLSKSVIFNILKEKTTKDVIDALSRMYEKSSATNKVFLMRKLFNMKMVEGGVVAEHLKEFNTVMSQLSSVNIQFEDEIWALLVLSSLPDSWNGIVTLLSNSSGSTKLKFDDVVSAIQSLASTSFTSSVFGLNSSASASTLNSSSSADHSAASGSLFSTQVAPAVSSFPAFTQTMPSQFGSSASASLFGSGSSFGSAGSSSFVSTSSFGSTIDGAKLFGSGTVFGLSSSSSFSTASSSFGSSSSSFAPSGTTSLFGSSSQPAASSIFGSRFSSSSPSTTFSFGALTTAGSTPPAFGSSLGASSGSSMFSFTSAAAASSSSTLSSVRPVFGMSNPVDFGSASPGNDQMNVEDSMAEDTVQASTPTAAPAFGQLANTSSSSNFGFGSTAVPAGWSSVFQFGSHQNTSTPQSPSPFTAPGNLEFPSGGSFSLGTVGVDKSNRKFVRARRDKHLEFPSGGSFSLGTVGVDKSNRKFVRARPDKHRKK